MATSHLLRPLLRPAYIPLALTSIGLGTTAYSSLAHRKIHRLDTAASPGPFYERDRLVKKGGGLDPKMVRQISQGSVAGMLIFHFSFCHFEGGDNLNVMEIGIVFEV